MHTCFECGQEAPEGTRVEFGCLGVNVTEGFPGRDKLMQDHLGNLWTATCVNCCLQAAQRRIRTLQGLQHETLATLRRLQDNIEELAEELEQ